MLENCENPNDVLTEWSHLGTPDYTSFDWGLPEDMAEPTGPIDWAYIETCENEPSDWDQKYMGTTREE